MIKNKNLNRIKKHYLGIGIVLIKIPNLLSSSAVKAAGVASILSISLIMPSTAQADPSIEAYKIYAHIKLGNDKAYRCLVTLWTKESQWNPKAKNPHSSAYGIPQLLKLKERDPYKQIDLGIKYIKHHRSYKGDICKALAHHKSKGYY